MKQFKESEFEDLVGKTLIEIQNDGEKIKFITSFGLEYQMYHSQDCCEQVSVEEVIGDFADLLNFPILKAEKRENNNPNASESGTWTFYELATIKGNVTIRWYGSSNGYYSESVDFYKEITNNGKLIKGKLGVK